MIRKQSEVPPSAASIPQQSRPITPSSSVADFKQNSFALPPALADLRSLEELNMRAKGILHQFVDMGMTNVCEVDAKKFRSFDTVSILRTILTIFQEMTKEINQNTSKIAQIKKPTGKNSSGKKKSSEKNLSQDAKSNIQSNSPDEDEESEKQLLSENGNSQSQGSQGFSVVNYLVNLAWQYLESRELTSQFCWSLIDELREEATRNGEFRIILQLLEISNPEQIAFYLQLRQVLIDFFYHEESVEQTLFLLDHHTLTCEQWIALNTRLFTTVNPQESLDYFLEAIKANTNSIYAINCSEYVRIALDFKIIQSKKNVVYDAKMAKYELKQKQKQYSLFLQQQQQQQGSTHFDANNSSDPHTPIKSKHSAYSQHSKQQQFSQSEFKLQTDQQSPPQNTSNSTGKKSKLDKGSEKFGVSFYRWGWPFFSKKDFDDDIQLSYQRLHFLNRQPNKNKMNSNNTNSGSGNAQTFNQSYQDSNSMQSQQQQQQQYLVGNFKDSNLGEGTRPCLKNPQRQRFQTPERNNSNNVNSRNSNYQNSFDEKRKGLGIKNNNNNNYAFDAKTKVNDSRNNFGNFLQPYY